MPTPTPSQELAEGLALLRHVIASLGELPAAEREALSKTLQGECGELSQAGARGRRDAVRQMRDSGMKLAEIAAEIGISRPGVSGLLR
jgi:uncharacterized protein YbjQ (UPF0145 family)